MMKIPVITLLDIYKNKEKNALDKITSNWRTR
jgi:hypothetical protein